MYTLCIYTHLHLVARRKVKKRVVLKGLVEEKKKKNAEEGVHSGPEEEKIGWDFDILEALILVAVIRILL